MNVTRIVPLAAALMLSSGAVHAQGGDLPALGESRGTGIGAQSGTSSSAPEVQSGQPRQPGQGLNPRQPAYDTPATGSPGMGRGMNEGERGMRRDTPPSPATPGMTPPGGMQPGQMGPGGVSPTPPAGGTPPGQPGFGRP